LVWTPPIILLAAGAGIWISSTWIARWGDKSYLSSPCFIIVLILVAITLIFSILNGLRKVQRLWASYRLFIDENSIKRLQDGLPDIAIDNGEISKISEAEGRGLLVQSIKPSRQIGIPFTLQDYSEVRSELARRHTIDKTSGTWEKLMPVLTLAAGLLTLVAVLITFLATNRYVIVITGVLLFLGMIMSLVSIQRSIYTTKEVKRNSWLVLLPILLIGVRIFFVITNR
jgi:hypothetical protein